MSYKGFDWIDCLPPDQRAVEQAKRDAFFDSFPRKSLPDEVDRIMALSDDDLRAEAERDGVDLARVGRDGAAALDRAVNTVEGMKIANVIMGVCDMIGSNPRAIIDRRAWEHLIVYIPLDLIADRLTKKTADPTSRVIATERSDG